MFLIADHTPVLIVFEKLGDGRHTRHTRHALAARLFVELGLPEIALMIDGLAAVAWRSRLPDLARSVPREPGQAEDGGDAVLCRL